MTYLSFFQIQPPLQQGTCSPCESRGWGQDGLGWPCSAGKCRKRKGPAHTSRAYHDHHLGSGALNLPLCDAKSLAVHFRVPRDGGGVRRGFPTVETSETSFRNAEVWLPWCARQGEGQMGGAEAGPVTMVTIDAGVRNFLPEPRS